MQIRKTEKTRQLFEIIDDIHEQWVRIEENIYTGKPNRLDKMDAAAHNLEKLAVKMQKQIKSMRRTKK